jgi:glucoamylase
MGGLSYRLARPAVQQADLATLAPYTFWLMFRNVASDGLVFADPVNTGVLSSPGAVLAAIYGAEAVTDPRLLATAAQLRAQWADPDSKYFYPINGADGAAGLGPLLGRYPGDVYDGDNDSAGDDHPWALTTANFAELYYRLATKISSSGTVPSDALTATFLAQVGVTPATAPLDAAAALRAAGDAMLQAIVYHSDHFELSEQFDAVTGFEKSVSNLSWSYAAFLSAVRARTAPA